MTSFTFACSRRLSAPETNRIQADTVVEEGFVPSSGTFCRISLRTRSWICSLRGPCSRASRSPMASTPWHAFHMPSSDPHHRAAQRHTMSPEAAPGTRALRQARPGGRSRCGCPSARRRRRLRLRSRAVSRPSPRPSPDEADSSATGRRSRSASTRLVDITSGTSACGSRAADFDMYDAGTAACSMACAEPLAGCCTWFRQEVRRYLRAGSQALGREGGRGPGLRSKFAAYDPNNQGADRVHHDLGLPGAAGRTGR